MTRFGDGFSNKDWLKEIVRAESERMKTEEKLMPIADEPISPERLKELEIEKGAARHDALFGFPKGTFASALNTRAEMDKALAEINKMTVDRGVALTSIEHPDCHMTRLTEIARKLYDRMIVDFDDFERAFRDAAHEYAIEADWVSMNSDAMDRVNLKKWAYKWCSPKYPEPENVDNAIQQAEKILAWLLKP